MVPDLPFPLPLRGRRVVECGTFIAGPYCALLLADLGADVIKVEPPRTGDGTRATPPFQGEESAGFLALNRNKRSLALDLKQPRGREIFLKLLATADVLVENYRPGTMAALGLDYASLQARFPRLIYCSASGFGQTGPYAQRPGLDLVVQGMSGLMSVTGSPGGEPVKCGVPLTDLGTALYGAYGVLAALMLREQTGAGTHVDVSLFGTGVAFGVWETSGYLASGEVPGPLGSAHRVIAPYQALPTRDGWITVGAANQSLWQRLCEALGRQDLLQDPRFTTNADRKRHERELAELLARSTRELTTAECTARLEAAGVPCGPIRRYDAVLADPHLHARGLLQQVVHPSVGPVTVVGTPVHLSGTPLPCGRPAPRLGEHTDEILAEIGIDVAERAALAREGVV